MMSLNTDSLMEYNCVHVGLHKCASTLFQNHIFPKHPDIGLVSGRSSSEQAIHPHKLYKSNTNLNAMGGSFDYGDAKDALTEAVSQFNQNKTIVLSDESYSGDLLTGRTAQTKARVLSELLGNKIKVIVTLRDQYGYIYSAWREHIRAGGVMSLTEFLSNHNSSPAFVSRFYSIYNKIQYHDYVKYLYQHFGEDNVKVMFLEELKKDFGSFVDSVYEFLDLDPIDINNTKERPGLGFYEATFLRFFNQVCKGSYNQSPIYLFPHHVQSAFSNLMIKITRTKKDPKLIVKKAFPSKKEFLTDGGVEKIDPKKLIRESNRELNGMVEKNLEELGYEIQ